MDRNVKYKQVCRVGPVGLFDDDDVNTSTNAQYIVYPSTLPSVTVNNGGTNYVPSFTQIRRVGVVALVLWLQTLLFQVVL